MDKTLEYLENKYGGIHYNTRNIKSIHEGGYYTKHRGGDRMNSEFHKYSTVYSKFLNNKKINNMVEVGVLNGTGLAIWCDIFPEATIHGYDIDLSNYKNNYNNLIKMGAFTK